MEIHLFIFRKSNKIHASVICSEPAKDFLEILNKENKCERNMKQESFYKVVEKVLTQNKLNEVKSAARSNNKRTFKKLSRNLMLMKLFSHSKQNKDSLNDIENSEISKESENESLSYFSCNSSQNVSFHTARSSLRHQKL